MKARVQTIQFTLIRHGESTSNVGSVVGGNTAPLTDEGRRQATLLGEYLTRIDGAFDAAWYSTLPRAVQTFEEIMAVLPKDRIPEKRIFADERIIERQHGMWEGRPIKETWTPEEIARINQLGADYSTPGGESFRLVERRMNLWLDDAMKIARLSKLDLVHFLVVCHGHAMRCLIGSQLQISSHVYWRMTLDNTSITRLRWTDDKGWFLDCMNSRPHLDLLARYPTSAWWVFCWFWASSCQNLRFLIAFSCSILIYYVGLASARQDAYPGSIAQKDIWL